MVKSSLVTAGIYRNITSLHKGAKNNIILLQLVQKIVEKIYSLQPKDGKSLFYYTTNTFSVYVCMRPFPILEPY